MKKFICLFLALVFCCVTLSGCGLKKIPSASFNMIKENVTQGIVAENSAYSLEYDSENANITLIDRVNNKSFSTTAIGRGEAKVDEYGIPIKNHPKAESPLIVEYIVPDTGVLETLTGYTDCTSTGDFSAKKIKNGICITYYFKAAEIAVPVEYTLSDKGLAVSIKPQRIMENENKVFQIYVSPLMCSVENNSQDGYLFVPSGSGGIIYPEQTDSAIGRTYTTPIFGEDPQISPYYQTEFGVKESAKLPVFGAVDADSAVCGIIEKGAESALINAQVGIQKIPYSFVGAIWRIRSYQNIIHSAGIGQKTENRYYSDNKVEQELRISYTPLYGEAASYSGMARLYREYLFGADAKKTTAQDDLYSLRFIGGVEVDSNILGVPYKKLLCTTSLKRAKEIFAELTDLTGTAADVLLSGYSKSGISTGGENSPFGIANKLGNREELKKLNKALEAYGATLYLDFELLNTDNANSKTALGADGKRLELYKTELWSGMKNKTLDSFYMCSRSELRNRAEKAIRKAEKFDVNGISFGALSSTAFSDYSQKYYYVKSNTQTDFKNIAKKLSLSLASRSANSYAAAVSSKIFEAPVNSDSNDLISLDVPFYQIVFKGKTALTVPSINYSPNETINILKATESGIGLSFTLFDKFDKMLVNSYDFDFTSGEYSSVKEDIKAYTKAYSEYFDLIKKTSIKENQIISKDVRKTVFENGVTVFVNYGNESVQTPLGELKGGDYIYSREVLQ